VPRERGQKVVATNRKARHDYTIEDTYEAGMVLTGTEVKSLREGRASLVDGYAFIDGGEMWLDAVHIPEYTEGTWNNHAPRRKRKLLLHKQEIVKISHKTKEGGYTLVPLQIYFADGRASRQARGRSRDGEPAQPRRLNRRPDRADGPASGSEEPPSTRVAGAR
jgi:SsrA-binding protein